MFGGEPDHDTAVYDRSVREGATAVTVKMPGGHVTKVMEILESHRPIDIDDRAVGYGLESTAARTPFVGKAALVGAAATDGGTLQLSEETLAVGKRVVNRGTTRIRRFVVETPVEEQVSLHEEHVTIDRHPVTDGRPVTDADFSDRTVEMTETAEEAVVSKTARVREEISIRKDATDRTESVRDTVRREDVEIVTVPGGATTTSTTATEVDPLARKSGV